MEGEVDAMPAEKFFRFSENGNGPWEIGRPQSVIIKLVEKGIFNGEVLDIGCGIADNAIYIVQHANHVNLTGIDLVN
jgi:tRNA1(Val) A37 N6-methylase TrmN6